MINFKIEKFEGPLNLLLSLIEKEELDITEVSLSKIADQYVEYIRASQGIDPEMTADFLVVAAKLLYIKSKALLPYLYIDDEEEDIADLEYQLKMYKEFLVATKRIEKILGKKKFMFPREFSRKAILSGANMFSPPKNLSLSEMSATFRDLIERVRPEENDLEESRIGHKINIEEKILHIQQALINKIKISFSQLLNSSKNKTEAIVNFLAMLELLKQENINVSQKGLFEEISIEKYE